jgi:threonyl-tRNA synthetase
MPPQKPTQQNLSIEKIRHSLAHIMASAVQNLYGQNVQLGIGPVIENGFYYDIDFGSSKLKAQSSKPQLKTQNLSDADLPLIAEEIRRLIGQNLGFVREEISIDKAMRLFSGQKYKLELIKDIEKFGTSKLKVQSAKWKATAKSSKVSIYHTGRFVDLCQGPHIKNTRELKSVGFKLTKVAGAYWRGDEKNPMLTRIYGLAFDSQKELDDYVKMMEESERRDHRKLGQQLGLFSWHDEGPGMAFWHPKGMVIKNLLVAYWRDEHKKAGYQEISTPVILKDSLWHTSGHMKNYKQNMYFTTIDETNFAIKPMNCPGGLLYYKERPHSYRELPLRLSELGLVHRHELAGVLHGLFRVRSFTQDDAHLYCTKEQVESEIEGIINLTQKIYKTFGFTDYHIELSTRPKKYTGELKLWKRAEQILEKILKRLKLKYKINPGDGAFYGPKIDFHIKDSIGRTWQCGTIQLDFAQPENFQLEYVNEKGKPERPVMLHRTIFGSLERFIGILTEHYAGAFPVWLAPVQVMLVPVSQNYIRACQSLREEMKSEIRVEVDDSDETVGNKIRQSSLQKIPYTIVIGEKEAPVDGRWHTGSKLTIRQFGQKEIFAISLGEFLEILNIC